MAYPHKWSPISYKSSAGQRKHIGQRPMLYRWTTPLGAFLRPAQQKCIQRPHTSQLIARSCAPANDEHVIMSQKGRCRGGGWAACIKYRHAQKRIPTACCCRMAVNGISFASARAFCISTTNWRKQNVTVTLQSCSVYTIITQ